LWLACKPFILHDDWACWASFDDRHKAAVPTAALSASAGEACLLVFPACSRMGDPFALSVAEFCPFGQMRSRAIAVTRGRPVSARFGRREFEEYRLAWVGVSS